MVGNAHLDEIAHYVELVVASLREMRHAVEKRIAVDIAARLLRRKDDGNPLFDLLTQEVLSRFQFRVVARVKLQRKQRRLNDVVWVCVRPLAPFELRPLCVLCGQELPRMYKIQQLFALAAYLHLANAVRNPLRDEHLVLLAPEPADLDVDLGLVAAVTGQEIRCLRTNCDESHRRNRDKHGFSRH